MSLPLPLPLTLTLIDRGGQGGEVGHVKAEPQDAHRDEQGDEGGRRTYLDSAVGRQGSPQGTLTRTPTPTLPLPLPLPLAQP